MEKMNRIFKEKNMKCIGCKFYDESVDCCNADENCYQVGVEDGINRLMYALRNPITLDALLTAKDRVVVSAIIKRTVDEITE